LRIFKSRRMTIIIFDLYMDTAFSLSSDVHES